MLEYNDDIHYESESESIGQDDSQPTPSKLWKATMWWIYI